MIYTIIIDRENKVNIAKIFDYEIEDYKTISPDLKFKDRDDAIEWIRENINPELISDSLREKYLLEDFNKKVFVLIGGWSSEILGVFQH